MKPPGRARAVPSRFAEAPGGAGKGAAPGGGAWSVREKRALLRGLREQAAGALPEALPELLRERLPRRGEAEIRSLLCRLRGRAAREAVGTRFRLCLERQRQLRALPPAPIEVWLELAQTLSEGLEEPTAAALAQVLTVAGTEPLSLLRSVPPRPRAPMDLGGPPPESQDPPGAPLEGFAVDFQRVYEFLGLLCRGGGAALPPPGECAVLLALLGALPPALGTLDRGALGGHLRGAYSDLTAPRPPPHPKSAPPNPPRSTPSGSPHPKAPPSLDPPPQISLFGPQSCSWFFSLGPQIAPPRPPAPQIPTPRPRIIPL